MNEEEKDKRIVELEKELASNKKLIEQFKGLLDSIPDPVFMKDENLLWIYGNPVILNLYNINPNNYIGKSEDKLLPIEFAKSCMLSDEKARDAKCISKSEERARDENGNIHFYEVFKVPFYENEEFKGLIGVGRDITETKIARQNLEKALEQQKLLTQQSKLISMGEMMENIAHQWKQPLSTLFTVVTNINMQLQMNDITNQDLAKNITLMLNNINYMNQTIDDFKNFFQEDKIKKDFFFKQIIEKSLVIADGYLKELNIEVEVNIQEDIEYNGYKNELIHVILNLISNSKDALLSKKDNRKIFINLYKKNKTFCIKFSDNAGGIPSNIINQIFEAHFTTKKELGTGIGLYMCKIIIDSFKGDICVTNNENGAVFTISLPL